LPDSALAVLVWDGTLEVSGTLVDNEKLGTLELTRTLSLRRQANSFPRPTTTRWPSSSLMTWRVLLAGDAEAREEEYMANGPYTGPLTVIKVPKLPTTL
jgi:hypothetical protein